MIKEKKPLTLAEVVNIIGDGEKAEKIKLFSKSFIKLNSEEATAMKEKIRELNLFKLNEESIVSLINFMPSDAQDVMKVLEGISLEQEEIDKILGVLNK